MERKKKAGVAVLISDKTDFKPTKGITLVKGSMQQEELIILNIYMHLMQEHPDS